MEKIKQDYNAAYFKFNYGMFIRVCVCVRVYREKERTWSIKSVNYIIIMVLTNTVCFKDTCFNIS